MKETAELITEARRVIDEESDALKRISERIDSTIARAARIIKESGKTIAGGVGKSGLIAQKIAATLSSVGAPATFMHPVEALHGDLGLFQKNDCALLLSKSGATEELIKLIPHLKSRDVSIIAIVGATQSYLARNADVALDAGVEKEACPLNLAPMSSAIGALALGDALAACVMKLERFSSDDFAKLHPLGQLGKNATLKVKDLMHKNSNIPAVGLESHFRDALIEMTNKSLGCVCALDDVGLLRGIITDGDVRRILQKHDEIRDLKTADVMTKDPVAISEDAFLSEALSLMENRTGEISVLPAVDKFDKLSGVIRIHDIIRSGI